jgi:hypothetical protein
LDRGKPARSPTSQHHFRSRSGLCSPSIRNCSGVLHSIHRVIARFLIKQAELKASEGVSGAFVNLLSKPRKPQVFINNSRAY